MSNPSDRIRLRRLPERGAYDRPAIDSILDAMPLAHVGYLIDGAPFVTPTLQWREGDHVYWHGSAASRMLDKVDDAQVCVTITIFDGMVIARSAFHHSVNYRSVMLFGRARKIEDPAAKETHLKAFVDGLFPGRWDILRPVQAKELKGTSLLSLEITEGSAKVRMGPPKDDEPDYALPIWAGVLPVHLQVGEPINDPRLEHELEPPDHIRAFRFEDLF